MVIFRISRAFRPGMDEDQVYDVTHGWWSAAGARRDAAAFAIAVAGGIVRGVFQVHGWVPDPRGTKGKWGFDGQPVGDAHALVGRDVSHLFRRGAANPVSYAHLSDLVDAPLARLGLLSDALVDDVEEVPDDEAGSTASTSSVGTLGRLQQLAERLVEQPLFHASLGSKELFHSNVLAWLCERHPHAGAAVLAPWSEIDEKQRTDAVLRERAQLDLVVVRAGSRPVVFENKVFSAPDESQLDRYAAKNVRQVVDGRATLVLLSLGDPGWADGTYTTPTGETWQWRSYEDLATALESLALPLLEGFDRDFLAAYIDTLRTLVQLLQLVLVADDSEPVDLPEEWKPLLVGARLWDAARKLRSRHIGNRLRERLETGMAVHTDFRNGDPVLSVVQEDGQVRLGWQLQGRQFRRLCMLAQPDLAGRGPAHKLLRAAYCAENLPSWFDPITLLKTAQEHVPAAAPPPDPGQLAALRPGLRLPVRPGDRHDRGRAVVAERRDSHGHGSRTGSSPLDMRNAAGLNGSPVGCRA